ncbi:hypothetical protein ACYSNU_00150 [Enterococcus sp. LJL120]
MGIKGFQKVARILYWFFLITYLVKLVPLVFLTLTGIIFMFLDEGGAYLYEPATYTLFTADVNSLQQDNLAMKIIDFCSIFLSNFALITSCYLGSEIFYSLSLGETPFSPWFVRKIRNISFLLVLEGLYAGVLYSVLQSLAMPNGYLITLGVGPSLFIGLIMYAVAGIIQYGIELQKLSDDVI